MTNHVNKVTFFRKSQITLYEIVFILTLVSTVLIFIGKPYQINLFVSIGTRILIISNTLCGFQYLYNKVVNPRDNGFVTLAILLIASCLISFLLSHSGGYYDLLINILCFLSLPFYILFYREIKVTKNIRRTIYLTYIFLSFLYIYLSFTPLSHIGYNSYGIYYGNLSLGYDNPNETAIYLLVCMIVLFSAVFYFKSQIAKLFLILDIAYLFYLLVQTDSRTCFIVFLLVVFSVLTKLVLRIKKGLITFLTLLPFVFIYINLVFTPWLESVSILEGSAASGRDYVFQKVFVNMNFSKFLFGDLSGMHFQNLHNGYLSIFATVGILGLLTFYCFFRKTLLWARDQLTGSLWQIVAFAGLLGVIIQSSSEAALLVSGVIYSSSVGMMLLLVQKDEDARRKKEEAQHGSNLLFQLSDPPPDTVLQRHLRYIRR